MRLLFRILGIRADARAARQGTGAFARHRARRLAHRGASRLFR